MKDKDKTKDQLLDELSDMRKQIYEFKMFKLTTEHVTKALIESETKLIEHETRYRMIFENANDGIIIHTADGLILDVNKNMYTRLGYSKKDILKMKLQELVGPGFEKNIPGYMKKLEENGVAIFESGDKRVDGSVLPVEVSARSIEYKGQPAILSVVRDITRRKLAEDLIRATLDEKDLLVKELQNQVKRNLQILSVIVRYQSRKIQDTDTVQLLEKMNGRLESFTKIYEKFY